MHDNVVSFLIAVSLVFPFAVMSWKAARANRHTNQKIIDASQFIISNEVGRG